MNFVHHVENFIQFSKVLDEIFQQRRWERSCISQLNETNLSNSRRLRSRGSFPFRESNKELCLVQMKNISVNENCRNPEIKLGRPEETAPLLATIFSLSGIFCEFILQSIAVWARRVITIPIIHSRIDRGARCYLYFDSGNAGECENEQLEFQRVVWWLEDASRRLIDRRICGKVLHDIT